jgi:hypothetical protein
VNGSPLYEVIWLGDLPLGVMKQTKTGNLVITRGSDQAILWRWESWGLQHRTGRLPHRQSLKRGGLESA